MNIELQKQTPILSSMIEFEEKIRDYYPNPGGFIEVNCKSNRLCLSLPNQNQKFFFPTLQKDLNFQDRVPYFQIFKKKTGFENKVNLILENRKFDTSSRKIIENLTQSINQKDLRIRYYENENKQKIIYGLVSYSFKIIDLSSFFLRLYDSARRRGFAVIEEKVISLRPRLLFQHPNSGLNSAFGLHLCWTIGLNNGYSKNSLGIGREVIVCKNGLTMLKFIDSQDFFHHFQSKSYLDISNLNDFVLLEHKKLNKNKGILEATPINDDNQLRRGLERYLKKPRLIKVTIDSYPQQTLLYGKNLFSVSQSLTFQGTSNSSLKDEQKYILRKVGSRILDEPEEARNYFSY